MPRPACACRRRPRSRPGQRPHRGRGGRPAPAPAWRVAGAGGAGRGGAGRGGAGAGGSMRPDETPARARRGARAGRGACAGATGWSGVCPWVWWLTGWRRAWLGRPRGVSQRSPRPLRSLCARPLPQLSLPSSMRSRTPRPLLLCVLRTHARRPSGRASAPRIASSNAHMACEQPLRRGRGGGHRRPGTTCAPPSDRPALMSPRPARTLARPATARLSLRWGTRRIYPECPGSGDASALSGVGAFREHLGYRNPGGARNDPESQMHGAISRVLPCTVVDG